MMAWRENGGQATSLFQKSTSSCSSWGDQHPSEWEVGGDKYNFTYANLIDSFVRAKKCFLTKIFLANDYTAFGRVHVHARTNNKSKPFCSKIPNQTE